ncbi:4-(cytidine 5'-diphospho)-2-C-methyl-D-erythritol kinase [Rhizobium sp. 9140]|uniref:4-(cytidine 5'-diphospho)-2-C-methyl-D-erythritol kinase n=1 Tax=Rhizobium sp. 9140 TaxID=1761900 RepID=UPI001FDAB906|nr:4-(cytidine 5'-diphospho)-2-C-methyl-D-erythritol kinase [Rhizobium sp. 9140]
MMAPAKINLALHVVGQRADGHHLLESLVTFADAGDRLSLAFFETDSFTVSGPFAGDVPVGADGGHANLVLKARDLLRTRLTMLGLPCAPVALHLTKNLPVASGIGGGSADAAAALTGLSRLWNPTRDAAVDLDLAALGLSLGADLPMCLTGRPLIARGIGEAITPVIGLPAFPALLVNPGAAVSTPAVFRALSDKTNPLLPLPERLASPEDWIAAIAATRNDLEPPALSIAPVIGTARAALVEAGAALARMSGSGATCFGLFLDVEGRDRAAVRIRKAYPDWYLLPCSTLGSHCGAPDTERTKTL